MNDIKAFQGFLSCHGYRTPAKVNIASDLFLTSITPSVSPADLESVGQAFGYSSGRGAGGGGGGSGGGGKGKGKK